MFHTCAATLRRGYLLLVVGVLLALGGFVFVQSTALAQTGIFYQEYNVDVTLRDDGSYTVRTVQTIRFDDEYNTAFMEIPTDRATSVQVVGVWQEPPRFSPETMPIPLDFSTNQEGDTLYLNWEYDLTLNGELRTFVVEYTVEGGLWVYDDFDVLQTFVINADRAGLPIYSALVTLHLPDTLLEAAEEGALWAEVVSGNGTAEIEGDRVLFTPKGGLADGEGFEIALEIPHGLLPVTMQTWQMREEEADAVAHIPALNVEMAIQPDGKIDVTEEIALAVDQGTIFSGYRTINLLYQDEVQNLSLFFNGRPLPRGVEGCDGCFTADFTPASRSWARWDAASQQVIVDEEAVGRMEIRWWTPPISAGESAKIDLRYTVLGGIRTGDDAQVINFDVLPDYDLEIDSSTLQIVPPAGVGAEAITIESAAAQSAPEVTAAGAILLRNQELPATRARWEVVITLPADATTAATPQWQQQFMTALSVGQAEAAAQARRTLGTRLAGLLAIVGAIGAAVWGWLRYGRRRTNEMLKGYVAEPPSMLAPGIVAYLMDRKASEKGVLASLFQLATAGLLEIDLSSGIQIRRLVAEPVMGNAVVRNSQGVAFTIADHQAALVNEVLIPHAPLNQFIPLDALATPLRTKLPEIFAQMGKDAQEFFLASSSSSSGGGWGCLGSIVAVAAIVVAFWLAAVSQFDGPTVTFLVIAGFALLVCWVVYAMRNPFGGQRRSASGEAEAQKWIKFRNYLLNLKEYGDLGAAQEIVDRYFAYAVALGTEKVVLAQAESMGAHLPPWIPVPTHHPYNFPSNTGSSGSEPSAWQGGEMEPRPLGQPMPAPVAASQPQASQPRPSLTGMSAAMGESLSSGSQNLGRTLTVAAGGTAASTVVLKSALRQRTMQFDANATPNQMLDDIMRQSLSDARTIQSRPKPSSPMGSLWSGGSGSSGGSGGSSWGGGGSSSGSSRSSGGFGGSSSGSSWSSGSSSRSSSSSSSSRSSSSSSSRSSSSSGGRSGFGKR